MPIPQVNERIKEAPVVALRAVFAGIGQLLLTADKVRARAAEQAWPPYRGTANGPASRPSSWRPPEKAGNGSTPGERAAPGTPSAGPVSRGGTVTAPAAPKEAAPAKQAAAAKQPAPAEQAVSDDRAPRAAASPAPAPAATPASHATPTSSATPAPAATDQPLPGYDDLSLPSLRARLRTLEPATIQAMLDYEKAHANRDPVLGMLERRLAKITAG